MLMPILYRRVEITPWYELHIVVFFFRIPTTFCYGIRNFPC